MNLKILILGKILQIRARKTILFLQILISRFILP